MEKIQIYEIEYGKYIRCGAIRARIACCQVFPISTAKGEAKGNKCTNKCEFENGGRAMTQADLVVIGGYPQVHCY